MKAESTIRKEMNRLYRLSKVQSVESSHRFCAYDMASALQWVLEKTEWTPHGLVEEANEK